MGLNVSTGTGAAGAVAGLASDIIQRLWPDKTEAERAQMAAVLTVVQGQLEANLAEAASPSLFVAGWRPFIGWVCGAACAWNWIGMAMAKFVLTALGHPVTLAPADLAEMWPLLMGMLGLGAFRTVEKIRGVA
jgi:hypothetical protein